MQPSTAALAALPMVERSHLETRVMAILNNDARVATRRGVAIPAAGVALCTLVLASVQPGMQASPVSVAIVAPPAYSAAPPASAPVPAAPAANILTTAPPVQVRGDSACPTEWRRGSNFKGRADPTRGHGRPAVLGQVGTHRCP